MLGLFWLLFWQCFGLVVSVCIFARERAGIQLYHGSVIGLVGAMWMPIPFAFLLGFSVAAHVCAVVLGLAIFAALWFCSLRKAADPLLRFEKVDKALLALLLTGMLLALWLLRSHTLQTVNGAVYTGQATYGDMAMHLGFITSMAEQQHFPFTYSILPGTPLCYPILCDSVSASLYLLGSSLRLAYIAPALLAFSLVFVGFYLLACVVCRSKRGAVLSWLLFFLNGGFGILYFMGKYSLHELFTGFYKTPTNLTQESLRWVNVIADMLLPQRATLFGWAVLFACLYLLYRAVFCAEESFYLPAGILGGLLPMIHTHSYLALGLVALTWLVYSAVRDRLSAAWWRGWLRFGLSAVALAVPQLLLWTFRSVDGNEQFLRLHTGWVNDRGDSWLWFWVKNVGLVFILCPFAFLFGEKRLHSVCSSAVLIYVLCEFVVFQPNIYDNNKLLYIGYCFACFLCADWLDTLLIKLNIAHLRRCAVMLIVLVGCNAALFTLARECLSGFPGYGYRLFTADDVAAAEYIKNNTSADDVFLTDDNHDNAVAVLTGRNIVCGSASYLYYHGLDYTTQQADAKAMLTDPQSFDRLKDQYGIDYIYFSRHEAALDGSCAAYFAANYPLVFTSDEVLIYAVR